MVLQLIISELFRNLSVRKDVFLNAALPVIYIKEN